MRAPLISLSALTCAASSARGPAARGLEHLTLVPNDELPSTAAASVSASQRTRTNHSFVTLLSADPTCDCSWSNADVCKPSNNDGTPCWRTCCAGLELVHIPHTSATALEDIGLKTGKQWGSYRQEWPWGRHGNDREWPWCAMWRVPRAVMQSRGHDPYAGRTTFCVVRHPFARAIATYLYQSKQEQRGAEACDASRLNQVIQTRLKLIDMGQLTSSSSFTQDASQPDCDWLPQWMYVEGDTVKGAEGCKYVLRQENVTSEMHELATRFGQHELAGSVELNGNGAEEPQCRVQLRELSDETRGLIRAKYPRDFEMFGYDDPLPEEDMSTHPGSVRENDWIWLDDYELKRVGRELEEASSLFKTTLITNVTSRPPMRTPINEAIVGADSTDSLDAAAAKRHAAASAASTSLIARPKFVLLTAAAKRARALAASGSGASQ